jgi:hypothetical protein
MGYKNVAMFFDDWPEFDFLLNQYLILNESSGEIGRIGVFVDRNGALESIRNEFNISLETL